MTLNGTYNKKALERIIWGYFLEFFTLGTNKLIGLPGYRS